jgi:hypothetical protein
MNMTDEKEEERRARIREKTSRGHEIQRKQEGATAEKHTGI